MHRVETAHNLNQLQNRPASMHVQTQHFSAYCYPNLEAHSSEKSNQNGLREKIRDKS